MSTTTFKGSTISITGPNAGSDWQMSDADSTLNDLRPGPPIRHMVYTPGASRDICVIKEATDEGSIIAKFECANSTDQKVLYFHGARHRPYIDVSAGTHGQTSSSILQIELE